MIGSSQRDHPPRTTVRAPERLRHQVPPPVLQLDHDLDLSQKDVWSDVIVRQPERIALRQSLQVDGLAQDKAQLEFARVLTPEQIHDRVGGSDPGRAASVAGEEAGVVVVGGHFAPRRAVVAHDG